MTCKKGETETKFGFLSDFISGAKINESSLIQAPK